MFGWRRLMQPRFITHPSYDQLHNAAITMVNEAASTGIFDMVVAPARGGLLFGVIASHKLNIPLVTVNYSSKHGQGDDKNHDNVLPVFEGKQKIFLAEDLVDSGESLKEIVEHFTKQGHTVTTAVFHYKESSVFHPNLYWWRIPKDSEFFCYPFEAP